MEFAEAANEYLSAFSAGRFVVKWTGPDPATMLPPGRRLAPLVKDLSKWAPSHAALVAYADGFFRLHTENFRKSSVEAMAAHHSEMLKEEFKKRAAEKNMDAEDFAGFLEIQEGKS